ncbi:type II toxin-antitoxin system RelE/ParE family toxin [Xanthomonas sacchari]|uniref:type II toxin-antitoxin system RelE/ParE family toxin n=1 Tax=Xanthomonas sacchari TaxID=56458 RepID=UPI002255D633
MTSLDKRQDFAWWQSCEKLPNCALCQKARKMECSFIDAGLGGHLYKKRVARPGRGDSGGYRTLLSAKIGRLRPWANSSAQTTSSTGRCRTTNPISKRRKNEKKFHMSLLQRR